MSGRASGPARGTLDVAIWSRAVVAERKRVTAICERTNPFHDSYSSPFDSQPDEPETYYDNCSEARAAGAAPMYQGEPGYASHLDRDNDGIACDP